MSSEKLFDRLKEKYSCVRENTSDLMAVPVDPSKDEKTVVVMPANQFIQLSRVKGFANLNGKTFAEHTCLANEHIPALKDDDSSLKKEILATFEEIPQDISDEEFFDHYFGICEKALDVVRSHGYTVIVH